MSHPKKSLFVGADGKSLAFTFLLVSSLFLLWGFCNGMIDVMDKHFQTELHLTLSQSAWVQTAHYLGYFLMALPAGHLASRLGYRGGIITGLLMVAIGGFWFIPATHIASFWAFLLGVCVIAAGLTFLETIANPYTTVLGSKEFAATRINLAQSCNGIGWVLGPIAGRAFFYGTDAAGQSTGAQTLWIPYAAVGVVVLVIAGVFVFAPVPDVNSEDEYHVEDDKSGATTSIWSHPHFVFAVVAQFFYVAAQSGIFSFFINYMTTEVPVLPVWWSTTWGFKDLVQQSADGIWHISNGGGSTLASAGFIVFLLGRVTGTWLLKRMSSGTLLGLYGGLNVVMSLLVVLKLGWLSVACVFGSYFFMSIMFPTIFALGIHGLGSRAKSASSYIVMAIMGGAILPKVMGAVGDAKGVSVAFIVPLVCFAIVSWYGFNWKRLSKSDASVKIGH